MSRTPSIDQNSSSFDSLFIRAGAGAGKTTKLIATFFDYVQWHRERHKTWPKIIVTTFTKKATQELKERLIVAAVKQNDPSLVEFISKKNRVHISTIHGVLSLFLNQNIETLGFTSEIKITDSKKLNRHYTKVLKDIIQNHPDWISLLESYTFKELLEYVIKASEYYTQYPKQINPVNKTDLLNLLEIKKKVILNDLRSIVKVLNQVEKDSWTEYNRFIDVVIQKIESLPLNKGLPIEFIDFIDERPSKPRFLKKNPPFDIETNEMIDQYFSAKGELFNYSETEDYLNTFHEFNQNFFMLVKDFNQKTFEFKRKTGMISISDLEILSLDLISQAPNTVANFSKNFDFFMIDEFQDTSPLQVRIVEALTQRKPQFVVGDPQQSIYLFRGARSEVFEAKQAAVKDSSGFKIQTLETNYRSDPRLMKFINHTFSTVSDQFFPLQPKTLVNADKSVKPSAYFIKSENEYDAILNHIIRLVKLGANYSDICILFSKNKDVLNFSSHANQFNIPVQPQIAAGFDQKREILDLMFLLKFLVNPHDSENLIGLLRSPWFSITDPDLVKICHENLTAGSLWFQFKNNELGAKDYQFLKLILAQYADFGVLPALEYFLLNSGLINSLYFIDSTGQRESNLWKFMAQLSEAFKKPDFSLNEFLSEQFSSLTADLTSTLSEGVPLLSSERVSVMTIHSSKGLEFPHVIIGGMSSAPRQNRDTRFVFDESHKKLSLSIFSDWDSKNLNSQWASAVNEQFRERELKESERLFYVAMTRAEETVALVSDLDISETNKSWHNLVRWPAVGLYDNGEYIVESIMDSEPATIQEENRLATVQIKPKFSNVKTEDPYLDQQISVTEMISHQNTRAANIETKISEQNLDFIFKADKGTKIHRIFESLKYNTTEAYLHTLSPEDVKAYNYLMNQSDYPFKSILSQGHAEWGFQVKTAEGRIQGQIDLWGVVDGTCYIIDYKTGSSSYASKALAQLQIYARCLKLMKQVDPKTPVKLIAVYPFEQKSIIHPE